MGASKVTTEAQKENEDLAAPRLRGTAPSKEADDDTDQDAEGAAE